MAKFYIDNIVRILRKRAGANLPNEVGIVMEVTPQCLDVPQSGVNFTSAVYRVLTLENCPSGCSPTDDYRCDELELISWGASLDIYQYGG